MSGWDITLRFLLLGLGTGGIYALGALGVVVIHRGSKTLNFAHGGFAVWGGFLFPDLRDRYGFPAPAAFLAVLALAAAGGALSYLLVLRPVRHTHPLVRLVATLGILGVLLGSADREFAGRSVSVRSSLPETSVRVLGQLVGEDRLIILGIAVAVTAALAAWSAFGRFPLATRAMAEHEEAAQAVGISPHVLGTLNWALGAAMAAASGALLAPIVGRTTDAISALVVYALAGALIGRFDSYWGALGGGLALGVVESLVTHWSVEYLPTNYSGGWAQAAPFLLVLIVLLAQRDRAANRRASVTALPVGTARIDPRVAAGGAVAVVLLALTVSPAWDDALATSLSFAILALSVVLLIGFANQVSLAQMTIAGVAALAAAQLSIHAHLPFELAPLAGAAVGAGAGLLVGLPSLRIRGSNLAVVTIGMGLAVTSVVFANAAMTGGFEGLTPRRPTIFGLDVAASGHPGRYAVVVLFWLLVCLVAVSLFRRSRFGRRLLVTRANERAATSMGIGVTGSKLLAFVVSSALAGVGGVLLAFRETAITFSNFSFNDSINLVVVTVIAGVGSVLGAILAGVSVAGGLFYHLITSFHLGFIERNYQALFGVALCATVVLHPNGVVWRRARQRLVGGPPGPGVPAVPGRDLVVEDATVAFGGVRAVDDASITVPAGTVVGLVGPNGAGKTTLLDAIGGYVPLGGHLHLGDRDLASASAVRRARAGIGRVFQSGELIEDLTVRENVQAAAESLGAGLSVRAVDLRHRLDLGDPDALPDELSLAQRRMVALERALAGNPEVLLLDEPGAGLSMTDSQALAGEIRRLARDGLGVLLVDHDMALVMMACDRIVVLQGGRVLASGTPGEIQANAEVREAYLGDAVEAMVAEAAGEPSPRVTT